MGSIASVFNANRSVYTNAKLLVTIIELGTRSDKIGVEITKARNTQNTVRDVYFAALDPNQERLRQECMVSNIVYQYRPSADHHDAITIEQAAIALACFSGNPEIIVAAKKDISQLYKRYYSKLFSNELSGITLCRYVRIFEYLDQIFEASRKAETETRRKNFYQHGRLFILDILSRPETIWTASEVGTNDESKKGLLQLLPNVNVFDNPKPEGLLERVIHIATNSGDLVLDSFAGSGTTGAVAHKMGRRWIMIELGEHCHTHIIPRLKKVIDGEDQGGISKAVNWKGGGGFRYYRLAPSLLEKDKWGNWIINKEYNPAMLAEALCKIEGFTYSPSDTFYWQHGYSTERDFIYVTTQNLSHEQLSQLADEVGQERTLLVLCSAFRGKVDIFPNLTIKKIPQQILSRCEWGHDDYSLKTENLPKAPPKIEQPSIEQPIQKSLFDMDNL